MDKLPLQVQENGVDWVQLTFKGQSACSRRPTPLAPRCALTGLRASTCRRKMAAVQQVLVDTFPLLPLYTLIAADCRAITRLQHVVPYPLVIRRRTGARGRRKRPFLVQIQLESWFEP